MILHVFVVLLLVCLLFSLALLWRLDWFPLRPSSSAEAANSCRLLRLSPRLHSSVDWRVSICACTPLV
jgi:hypothetical protein